MSSEEPRDEGAKRAAPSGRVVYHAIMREALDEMHRPTQALFWSGLAAGLSMGFSLIAEGVLRTHLPDGPARELVSKLGYAVGFVIVILGRQQLFTENTLTPVLPLLSRRERTRIRDVARIWGVVLLANLIGALVMGYVALQTSALSEDVRASFRDIGFAALAPPPGTVLLRAVLAGWLIALMVWLLPFSESARILTILLISYVVGIGHFAHIVAGAVPTFALAEAGLASWGRVLLEFIAPTLAGNIVGGVMLVAAINHAQVTAGGAGEDV